MVSEIGQNFAHVNIDLTSLPLTHVRGNVDILAAQATQLVFLRQGFESQHVVPLVPRLLSEDFSKLHLGCQEAWERSPLILTEITDSTPACPQNVQVLGFVMQKLNQVEAIHAVVLRLYIDLDHYSVKVKL